jgi:ABC-type transport system involved in multi-copper enzyme maturation permease subunit
MTSFNPKSIYTVAKKEFLDNVRNRWIILLTIIFILIIIVFSFLAGGQTGEESVLGGMEQTVMGLLTINSFLIPIIAIILGFSTISGEAESGSLSVVLSYPITRLEVLIGKFLGLTSVLVFSILLGYGIGGVVIAATSGTESGAAYLMFIFLSIVLGMVFLSASIFISSFCKRRVTSIGGGIFLFFWGMIIGSVLFGIYLSQGGSMDGLMAGTETMPDWLWGSVVLSPVDLHQIAVMQAFSIDSFQGIQTTPPAFMTMGFMLLIHFIWIIVALVLAYVFFRRRDI